MLFEICATIPLHANSASWEITNAFQKKTSAILWRKPRSVLETVSQESQEQAVSTVEIWWYLLGVWVADLLADSVADSGVLTGGFSGRFYGGFVLEWRISRRNFSNGIHDRNLSPQKCHRKNVTAKMSPQKCHRKIAVSVGRFCKPVEDRLGPKQAMFQYQVQHWHAPCTESGLAANVNSLLAEKARLIGMSRRRRFKSKIQTKISKIHPAKLATQFQFVNRSHDKLDLLESHQS